MLLIKKIFSYITIPTIILSSAIFIFLNSSCTKSNSNIIPYDKLIYQNIPNDDSGMCVTALVDGYIPPENAILKIPKYAPNGEIIKDIGFTPIYYHLDTNARYLNITKLDLSECVAEKILGNCFNS